MKPADRPTDLLIAVSMATMKKAESFVMSCAGCQPRTADMPFSCLIDGITGHDGATTDYLMPDIARCPNCLGEIHEYTIVRRASAKE